MKTHLLMKSSRALRRFSMNSSSNIPSSDRNGSWRFSDFPGNVGTTICNNRWVSLSLEPFFLKNRYFSLSSAYLAVPFQFRANPFEIAVPTSHTRLFLLEYRQVRLKNKISIRKSFIICTNPHPNLVVSVPHLPDAMGDRVDDLKTDNQLNLIIFWKLPQSRGNWQAEHRLRPVSVVSMEFFGLLPRWKPFSAKMYTFRRKTLKID